MESIVVFAVYDSIRCGGRNGGYRGSDQGESRLQFSVPGSQFSVGFNRGSVWRGRKGFAIGAQRRTGKTQRSARQKKCGAESGDPNLRFQPRLPGSVVGEASMGQVAEADKITGVTVLR